MPSGFVLDLTWCSFVYLVAILTIKETNDGIKIQNGISRAKTVTAFAGSLGFIQRRLEIQGNVCARNYTDARQRLAVR